MVVKLETIATLCADVYPTIKTRRDEAGMECSRRQKSRLAALPALVEDEAEEVFEKEKRCYYSEGLRRQKSVSPQRHERLRRTLALPSLSEDEEP